MLVHFDKTNAHFCAYTIHSERLQKGTSTYVRHGYRLHVTLSIYLWTELMTSRIAKKHGCPSFRGPWMMLRSRYFCPLACEATSFSRKHCMGQVAFVEDAIFFEKIILFLTSFRHQHATLNKISSRMPT